jgi:hypothetical protein
VGCAYSDGGDTCKPPPLLLRRRPRLRLRLRFRLPRRLPLLFPPLLPSPPPLCWSRSRSCSRSCSRSRPRVPSGVNNATPCVCVPTPTPRAPRAPRALGRAWRGDSTTRVSSSRPGDITAAAPVAVADEAGRALKPCPPAVAIAEPVIPMPRPSPMPCGPWPWPWPWPCTCVSGVDGPLPLVRAIRACGPGSEGEGEAPIMLAAG